MSEPTVDTGEIARMLGCERSHVTDRLSKKPGFPRPHVNLSSRLRRWKLSDIETYMKGKR